MEALEVRPRPVILAAAVCTLVLVSARSVLAAQVSTGEDVYVAAGETIPDDVYAQSRQITINGTVRGDVVALADYVVINGDIEGSVWTLARTVQLNGRVAGAVHAITISLAIEAPAEVDRDVIVAGYSVAAAPGSTIHGDVWAWTYQAQAAGNIGRNYMGRHNGVELNGSVGGSARVEVGAPTSNTAFNPAYVLPDVSDVPTIPPGLLVTDQARIAGGVTVLSSETPAPVPDAAQQFVTSISNFSRGLLPPLVMCALGLWLWPTRLVMAANTAVASPGISIGWGIVLVTGVLVAVYCLAIVALVVVALCALAGLPSLAVVTAGSAGLSASLVLLTLFVLWAWVSKVVFGYALMTWVTRVFNRTPSRYPRLACVVGTLAVAAILAVTAPVPLIGVSLDILLALVGSGAVIAQGRYVLGPPLKVQTVSPRTAW